MYWCVLKSFTRINLDPVFYTHDFFKNVPYYIELN